MHLGLFINGSTYLKVIELSEFSVFLCQFSYSLPGISQTVTTFQSYCHTILCDILLKITFHRDT